MKTHSYISRIPPNVPFLTYLPLKPEPEPCPGVGQPENPIHPNKKNQLPHGAGHTGLEPTH